MDIAATVGMIVGSGLTTAIAAWALKALVDRRAEKRRQTSYALKIALALHEYSWRCVDKFYGHPMETFTDEDDLPELTEFPADMDWSQLKPGLAARAAALQVEEASAPHAQRQEAAGKAPSLSHGHVRQSG